jgi:hypothetical protein
MIDHPQARVVGEFNCGGATWNMNGSGPGYNGWPAIAGLRNLAGRADAAGRTECADYRCAHAVRISGDWPDHIRLSDLEPLFVLSGARAKGR